MPPAASEPNPLGTFLRDRRTRLDPAALGFPLARRRTPGLRREEVAQRAHVSATWYTWLEQGRGGAPSADVLDRLARALLLTSAERDHLFHLALGHPPEARYLAGDGISPRLQRVLDALELSPAFVKTVTWDLVAWNRAAAAVLGFDTLPADRRNLLRRIFLEPAARAFQTDWLAVARFAAGAFRADTTRAGASANAQVLVDELRQGSPEFDRLWRENDVRIPREGLKQLRHPTAGLLSLEYSSFGVDGRPDLTVVVYTPATPQDTARIRGLLEKSARPARPRAARKVSTKRI